VKQIYPASITGKGSQRQDAGRSSVLDHAFGRSDPYTLGVEEEYMLLDPETWDLVQHIDSVLAVVADGDHQERLHAELMQSVLEVTTPVCRTAGDIHRSLAVLRGYVSEIARADGCRFASAGTHPFSLF
jgi:carboxylate-amine ligase